MNLWIVLAITWISISVVIADSKWFVQDPLLGEADSDNADLFSSENLLRVNNKQPPTRKVKPQFHPYPQPQFETKPHQEKDASGTKTSSSVLSDVESEDLLLVHATGRKPLTINKDSKLNLKSVVADNAGKNKRKEWFINDSSEENEGKDGLFPSENLIRVYTSKANAAPSQKSGGVKEISVTNALGGESRLSISKASRKRPVQPAGRRPLEIVESVNRSDVPGQYMTPNLMPASANVENWFISAKSERVNTEKDDLSGEHYIRVQQPRKQQKENKQMTQAKTNMETTSKKSVEAVRKPETATTVVKKDKFTPTETARRKPLQVDPHSFSLQATPRIDEPCEAGTDVDCLMEEDLILVNKKNSHSSRPTDVKAINTKTEKPKEKDISRESLHRRLLENGEVTRRERRAVDLSESEDVEEIEDVSEDVLWGEDTTLRRFRRAENDTEAEQSGDGGFDGETDINNSSHTVDFQTTMNITKKVDLSEEEIANISLEFVRQSTLQYQNFTGFQGVIVKNVTVDENDRLVIIWELQLSTSAAPGNNQKERQQNSLNFIIENVVPFVNEDLTIEGQNIFVPLNATIISGIAQNILENPCQAKSACDVGYVCVPDKAICKHLCYHESFNEQCRHGSTCQLNNKFQPYCQCGSGYTGAFCQTPVSESEYSTGQVVGAGVAGAVAVVGTVCSAFYLIVFKKKKEEDMEYSYFGDDDAPMQAYSDPDSNLGITNEFSIARPSIIQPLDLYHDDGAMA